MNYQRIYNQIIERAQSEVSERILHKKNGGYYEGHHIIPRCMGGEGESCSWLRKGQHYRHPNIVGLTAREHFLCHWLLIRIYTDNHSIAYAFKNMCKNYNKSYTDFVPSSRMYAEARAHLSMLGHSHMTKLRMSTSRKNMSTENKSKIALAVSLAQKGIPKSTAVCSYCDGEFAVNIIGRYHMDNCKHKPGNEGVIRHHSPEHQNNLFGPKPIVTCPHCAKTGGANNMFRYHFDKCRNKPGNELLTHKLKRIECPHCLTSIGVNRVWNHFDNCKQNKK